MKKCLHRCSGLPFHSSTRLLRWILSWPCPAVGILLAFATVVPPRSPPLTSPAARRRFAAFGDEGEEHLRLVGSLGRVARAVEEQDVELSGGRHPRSGAAGHAAVATIRRSIGYAGHPAPMFPGLSPARKARLAQGGNAGSNPLTHGFSICRMGCDRPSILGTVVEPPSSV